MYYLFLCYVVRAQLFVSHQVPALYRKSALTSLPEELSTMKDPGVVGGQCA